MGKFEINIFWSFVTVLVVAKNLPTLDSPRDDRVQRPRCIYPGLPWHVAQIAKSATICKYVNTKGVPFRPKSNSSPSSIV